MTLCGAGLRAGELVSLERRDYNNGILTVRQGKGRKYREIHVAAAVDKVIRAWIKASGVKEAGDALFNRIQRNGRVTSQPLTTTGLTGILEQLQQTSDIARFTHMICDAPLSPVYWSRAWTSIPYASWQAIAT